MITICQLIMWQGQDQGVENEAGSYKGWVDLLYGKQNNGPQVYVRLNLQNL